MKNDYLHPVLLEIADKFECSFWKPIFENLAHGSAPLGCYINQTGFLTCTIKGKEFTYYLSMDTPVDTMRDDIVKLFQERLNILSLSDRIKKVENFNRVKRYLKDKIVRSSWGDIRRKNIKDVMIEMYVINLYKKGDIDIRNAKYLLATNTIALIFKHLVSSDITYINGKISNIAKIKNGVLACDQTRSVKKANTNSINKAKTTIDSWNKFIVTSAT